MRFTLFVITLAAALAGCEKDLLADLPDAAPDVITGCATPDQPLAAGTYRVYLNTEGVTLKKVSPAGEDSRTNSSNLIAADNTVVPPFLAGNPDRDAFIDGIVTKAQAALAPYSIDVVTARPASGDYEMFVLGGDPVLITGAACPNCGGVGSYAGCGRQLANRNHVSIYYDYGDVEPVEYYASSMLAEIGMWGDLVPTTEADDCMCRFDAACLDKPIGIVCTFGSNVPTTTALASDGSPFNCNISPQDEPALLKAAFGCR